MCKSCVKKVKGKGKSKSSTGKFFDSLDKALGNGKFGTSNARESVKAR